ncbi:cell division protein FtsL [Asticcacaulis solisilvae]|uniref:cell division protein FtsL n=1 Tax=Asticcacaulis solisilvae TaxID=1217274 RepID=UPI003FD8FB4C
MRAITALFEQRVRGFRLIELIGLGLALAMIFWVCLSKAREGEDIKHMNQLDQQIADESTAVDALKIRVAQLERPSRLEALAKSYLNMKPVEAAHEAQIDSLSEISHTTSRPVAAASAPVVAQAPADPLISVGNKPAPAVPAVSAAPLTPGVAR